MFKPKSDISKSLNRKVLALSFILLFSVGTFVNYQASASVLSASMKNPPQATADLLTLNNTSGTHLWWVSSTGKMFAASNADFHSSTTVFDSGNFCIRNPSSTFTTCVTNSAVSANRTLTWPLITGTDTLATLGLSQTFSGTNTFSGTVDHLINTDKFGSSSIVIRNPASTFAYTLTGGAIAANRTLNIPVITGTDTLATLGLAQTFTGAITSSGGIVMSSASIQPSPSVGTAVFALDIANSGTFLTIAGTNSTGTLSGGNNFSGMFIINDQTTGQNAMFLTGGGAVVLIAQTGSEFVASSSPTGSHTGVYNSASVITFKNAYAVSHVYQILAERTRFSD